MRIGNSPVSTSFDNSVNHNNSAQSPAKTATETFVQNSPAQTGSKTSALMRSGEMNISADLRASQLRTNNGTFSTSGVLNAARRPSASATNLQVVGTSSFRSSVAKDLATFAPGTTVDSKGFVHAATTQVSGHSQGYQLINNLLNGKSPVTINFTSQNAFTNSGTGAQGSPTNPGAGSSAQVSYDPAWSSTIALPTLQKDGTSKDQTVSSAVVLAHELIHATHAQRGTIDRSLTDHVFTVGGQQVKENWRFEELRTTGFPGQRQGNEPSENSIRAELGFQPRTAYLFSNQWQPA